MSSPQPDQPAYTTAIIAAVPTADDPVHDIVAEDAHVTLQFLGEAADLPPEAVDEIKDALEMVATVLSPFQVMINGTAELGEDKAQVLMVESELLSRIREILGAVPPVDKAVAASDQFPNWIPHLTMQYEGELPDVSGYQHVEIGSLELWLAEEKIPFPLHDAQGSLAAAGYKVFEEGLHPRGADGRFIEKFGIIKYLTSQGWQYGKVEGIYADPGSGATTLTVTPSNLAGHTQGESVMLAPAQVYRAPKAKTHLPVSAIGVKKIGGQAGSNEGGLYEIPHPGTTTVGPTVEQFYVKKPKTKSHGANEALANAFYEEAGVPVPEVDLHPNDGQLYSKIVQGTQDMATQLNNPEWADQVRRNFAVDAWLGNRDVFGMTYDNILTDPNGVPWRIDNGGALLYRAMGAKKTDFGGKVTELDSFRQGKKAKIFGPGMTKAQELDGAERVLAITPDQIDELVAEHGLPKSLADTLKARRAYIADYYGLPLPESKKPPETEQIATSAPLVDAPDIAANKGKARTWFKSKLAQLPFFGQTGDQVELPGGSVKVLGVDPDTHQALSIIAATNQMLGWQNQHGAGADAFLKKKVNPGAPRPEHGSVLAGADLTAQRWQRGDKIIDSDGAMLKVLTWNSDTGAMLVQFGDKDPRLLDTKGKDATDTFKVERWDPPAVDTAPPLTEPAPAVSPVMTEEQGLSAMDEAIAQIVAQPPGKIEVLAEPEPEPVLAPQPGKTGQAAVAEAAIKSDLDTPLPQGNGTPPPKKTSAPGGAKVMVIGDGTEAATGDAVTSKKDGKTYTFVKPKGQYAVVTDPNSETPDKQLLKLASTMTQPGKTPAADTTAVEAPKTATGEVPALGMMALAKDGWAGEITLISPDGKFVFITDANGTRKRKSTGTVSITGGVVAVADEPPAAVPAQPDTGGVKDYGVEPTDSWKGEEKNSGWLAPDHPQMSPKLMVHVGYADGSSGLEPYLGQPLSALEHNSQGKIAVYGDLPAYLGPVSSAQMVSAASSKSHTYQLIYNGNVFFADGTTGPNGGLVLWYADDNDADAPGTDAWELSAAPVTLTVVSNEQASVVPLTLPTGNAFQTADMSSVIPVNPPLWGEEAKTLSEWKGQLSVGQEISLDGNNWMEITDLSPGGSVKAKTGNGPEVFINPWSSATYVVGPPPLKDAATESHWTPEVVTDTAVADLPGPTPGKKKIGDLVFGDVVTDGNGQISIVDYVEDQGVPGEVEVKIVGENFPSPANPTFEFGHHGNIADQPTEIPAGVVAPHLYPGATLQFNSTQIPSQVVSYPQQQDNGSWKVVVMQDGDPENLAIVTIGAWDAPGVDVSNEAVLVAQLGGLVSATDAGVDPAKLNQLWNASTVVDTAPAVDHKIQMTDQGIPFGTAGYPIFYDESSGTYFRQGPTGLEEWYAENGSWNGVFGSTQDKEKVWTGVAADPVSMPEGSNPLLTGTTTYQPKPGEVVFQGTLNNGKSVLMVSQSGGHDPDSLVYTVLPDHATGGTKLSSNGFLFSNALDKDNYPTLVTLHDPFATAEEPDPINHQSGPQPPSDLGAKLQTLGYTPEPGAELWVTSDTGSGAMAVLVKQDNGTYQQLGYNGTLKTKVWTPEMLKSPESSKAALGDVEHYTWTYLPDDASAPATVPGLPSGFSPYSPGEGQSVLKVTLPNGKENVYLQKQPGAGWYEMAPDGTVNENSDAVKSNHAVQLKLQGKGSQAAKYELLHPKAEGQKATGADVPTFTTEGKDWTPEPHQKVIALLSYPNDPDPWYWVQDAPGEEWTPSPNTPTSAGTLSDSSAQGFMNKHEGETVGSSIYKLVFDGPSGQSAVDTPEKKLPSFHGFTPKPDEKVISYSSPSGDTYFYVQLADEKHWRSISSDGEISDYWAVYANDLPQNFGPEYGNDYKLEWPTEAPSGPETAPGAPVGTPDLGGYTPAPGDVVVKDNDDGTLYLQPGGQGQFQTLVNGAPNGVTAYGPKGVDAGIKAGDLTPIWPAGEDISATGPAGNFGGYQTEPGDIVIQMSEANLEPFYVKKAGTGEWHQVMLDGSLGDPYSQDTLEWAYSEYGGKDLQGSFKASTADPTPSTDIPEISQAYAGVAQDTALDPAALSFGDHQITAQQKTMLAKINGTGMLKQGQSLYAISYAEGGASDSFVIRNSQGQWSGIMSDGIPTAQMGSTTGDWNPAYAIGNNDDEAEAYFKGVGFNLHKAQFNAPTKAPAPSPIGAHVFSGWQESGIPDPTGFGAITDASQAHGAKAGDWVFLASPDGPGSGVFAQLSEDWTAGNVYLVGKLQAYKDGHPAGTTVTMNKAVPWNFGTENAGHAGFYLSGKGSGITAPAPAPAPAPAAPSAPSKPSYPGASPPSQEDINAWGGELTKDGHIPTAGMFVSGKGPMSGKIISVSKDKTKATVLTSDGKKTTRLISALKTDKTANYQTYVAPAASKIPVPSGMALAVDTPDEALAKTVQDGKFRAIVSNHPGVLHGEMVVSKATGPSGKNYSRVHLTLTDEQREQLVALLAGTGEKGDWATASKMSDQVAIGDKLPMRKSSTDNPDGTPRWKVDPAQVPPTHEVTAVTEDATGVKIVTMKDINTGEEITSRFHSGKSLTIYTWDPNKLKKVAPGSFGLSEIAKAAGWTKQTDGVISALKPDGTLYVEPGKPVSTSGTIWGGGQGMSASWEGLRNVTSDGVVVEITDPKGPKTNSNSGFTVITVPEGLGADALNGALAKLGIDYSPLTQDGAKETARGLIRNLLTWDKSDIHSSKGWTDDKLFTQAGQAIGIPDLGWTDVLVGVDESTGKVSYFWSDRVRTALAAKVKHNLIYRAASNGQANAIVSTVKYGTANALLKRSTGMIDAPTGKGVGASPGSDNGHHAGHGGFASASNVSKLPTGNSKATYKGSNMMVYMRPEAVLGRIMDYRVSASNDAFGEGEGQGSNNLKNASSLSGIKDYFLGGGLPSEAISYIAVVSASERSTAIQQLNADGITEINGRPIEEIVILQSDADKINVKDLPVVLPPSNARPVLDLPVSYDAPVGPAGAVTADASEEAA